MRILLYYAVLYGGAAGALKLGGFLVFIWLARSLSVEDYGQFGLLYALQQGLAALATAGIAEATIGLLKTPRVREVRGELYASANFVFLHWMTGGVVFALAVWFLFLADAGNFLTAYASATACGVILAFSLFQGQIVRLEERHIWSLLHTVLTPMSGLLGGFAAFALHPTVQSFFAGSLVGLVASALGLGLARVGFFEVTIRASGLRTIAPRAAPFVVVAFLGWLTGYGSNYLIEFFFARTDVAEFTFILSICSIMLLIANGCNQVWCPRFYRLIHERPFADIDEQNRQFYHGLAMSLGLVAGLIVAIFPSAMDLAGGNLTAYRTATPHLALLFCGYVVLTPWWHCQNYFLAHGMGTTILRITVLASLAGLAALFAFMVLLGPFGIYVGFFVHMLLRALGCFLVARGNWPVKVSWFGPMWGLVMIAIGMALSLSPLSLITAMILYLLAAFVFAALILRNFAQLRT